MFKIGSDYILRGFRSRTKQLCRLRVSRSRDNPSRYARRKCRCVSLRNAAMDETDRASKARISRARGFESTPEVSRTLSKSAGAFCRSRKFFQTAGTGVVPNFFHHTPESAGLGEIFIDLSVPRSVVALANERSQLSQFFRRKLIDR